MRTVHDELSDSGAKDTESRTTSLPRLRAAVLVRDHHAGQWATRCGARRRAAGTLRRADCWHVSDLLKDVPITLKEQILDVKREIGFRERLYPRWVEAGKMKMHDAEYRLRAMRAVLATLEGLEGD